MTKTAEAIGDTAPTKPLVMVIDDESFDQMIYARIIKRSGLFADIISMPSGTEALDYLADPGNPSVDLIFLDINMPRMNGFEFLEKAKAEVPEALPSCVIVMLTTSLDPRDLDRSLAIEEIRDYISKPLTQEKLGEIHDLYMAEPDRSRSD